MTSRGKRNIQNEWDNWGSYIDVKIQKLEKQYEKDLEHIKKNNTIISSIFEGIAIFVNGYTVPPADVLRQLMLAHGGTYHHYYAKSKVTHIIATNLAATKFKQITNEKIVQPEWIIDSIESGKLLPYQHYMLTNPTMKQQTTLSFHDDFKNNNMDKMNDSTLLAKNKIIDSPLEMNRLPEIFSNNETPLMKEKSAMSAKDPQFLSEFYNHSRLHLISSLGAEFKHYVRKLQEEQNPMFQGRERLKNKINENIINDSQNESEEKDESNLENSDKTLKTIMHIDMDCFFVSVGLRNKPELKGKPVAVTHSKGYGSGNKNNAITREIEKEYYKNNILKKVKKTANVLNEDIQEKINEDELHNDVKYNQSLNSSVTSVSGKATSTSCSEIACCSYEARKAGIHNGMFLGDALNLCPSLHTIPYDFDGYREVAYCLYNTIASYTHSIEAVSCDELYVDCTKLIQEIKVEPLILASAIREEVAEKTGCTCSAGFASNMLLARLATKRAKPNGQYLVDPLYVQEFIDQFSVKDLPGIGWSLCTRLENLGIHSCADLKNSSVMLLQTEFGPKTGQMLYNFCRGKDDRQVNTDHQRKSVSAEVNYGIRFTELSEVLKFIDELSDEVCKRLQDVGMKGKTITLKLKVRKKDAPIETAKFMGHGICDSLSRSISLNVPTDTPEIIRKEVERLFQALAISPSEMRGMGIQIQKLYPKVENNIDGQSLINFLKKSKEPKLSAEDEFRTTDKAVNKATDKNFDPSFSQIDLEVLNALPKQIQEELEKNYRRSKPVKPSPTKKLTKSPSKGKKFQANSLSNFLQQSHEVESVKANTEPCLKEELHATLCGVKTLPEVKALINEWITTVKEPQSDDASVIADYLKALVLEKNLERVDIIIRYINRMIKNINGENVFWEKSYNFIIQEVQELVVNLHGAPLKMP